MGLLDILQQYANPAATPQTETPSRARNSPSVLFMASDHLLTSASFLTPRWRAARPTASTVEEAGSPVCLVMNSIILSWAATPIRIGSGVPLCTTMWTSRSISLSRLLASGLNSARSTSALENSPSPIGIITWIMPLGARR